MMMMGITWLVFIAVFAIMTIINAVFWSKFDAVLLMFPIPAPVKSYVGQAFWIQPFSYVFILVLALIITYKIVQATADESDYFPEYEFDHWGPR